MFDGFATRRLTCDFTVVTLDYGHDLPEEAAVEPGVERRRFLADWTAAARFR